MGVSGCETPCPSSLPRHLRSDLTPAPPRPPFPAECHQSPTKSPNLQDRQAGFNSPSPGPRLNFQHPPAKIFPRCPSCRISLLAVGVYPQPRHTHLSNCRPRKPPSPGLTLQTLNADRPLKSLPPSGAPSRPRTGLQATLLPSHPVLMQVDTGRAPPPPRK